MFGPVRMPDSDRTHRWATQLHRLQQNSLVVWSAILGGVLLATLARWGIGGLVDDRTPFTTYYPAVVVVTLLGGFGWERLPLFSWPSWRAGSSCRRPSASHSLHLRSPQLSPSFLSACCWLRSSPR